MDRDDFYEAILEAIMQKNTMLQLDQEHTMHLADIITDYFEEEGHLDEIN